MGGCRKRGAKALPPALPASQSRTYGQRETRGAPGASDKEPADRAAGDPPGGTASSPSPVASSVPGAPERLTSPLRLPRRGRGKLSGSRRRRNAGGKPSHARPSVQPCPPAARAPPAARPSPQRPSGHRGENPRASRHRCRLLRTLSPPTHHVRTGSQVSAPPEGRGEKKKK